MGWYEWQQQQLLRHILHSGDKMLLRQHVFLTFLGHCDAAAVNLVCTKCDLQIGTRTLVLVGQRGDVDVSSDLLSIISMSSLTSGSQFSLMARLRMVMLMMMMVMVVLVMVVKMVISI